MTKKTIFLINLLFILNFIYKLYEYLLSYSFDYPKQSNFITYSQGFVRRGLWGELIKFTHSLNINTFHFIKIFSLTVFFSLIYYFYKQFKKNNLSINFLLLPFSISYIFLSNFIEFKDYFLILLIVLLAKLLKLNLDNRIRFLLINTVLVVGILIHEQFFFLTTPFFIFYFADKINSKKKYINKLLISTLYFVPALLALYLTIKFHGSRDVANKLFAESINLLPQNVGPYEMTGGISSIGGNLRFQLKYMFQDLIWNGFSRGVSYLLFTLTLLYILLNFNLFKTTKTNFQKNKKLYTIFCFQLLMMLPIFLFAIDWSRFISLALLSSLVLYFETQDFSNQYINKIQDIVSTKSDYCFKLFLKDNRSTFYIINYFCMIPYLELGNTPWQFTNSILMLMNYITKIIAIV